MVHVIPFGFIYEKDNKIFDMHGRHWSEPIRLTQSQPMTTKGNQMREANKYVVHLTDIEWTQSMNATTIWSLFITSFVRFCVVDAVASAKNFVCQLCNYRHWKYLYKYFLCSFVCVISFFKVMTVCAYRNIRSMLRPCNRSCQMKCDTPHLYRIVSLVYLSFERHHFHSQASQYNKWKSILLC